MADYFVRRGEKVFGPVTGEQVVGLAKSGKVRATDEIATDKNGPWQPITALAPLKAVFGQTKVGPLGPPAADPLGIGPQQQAVVEGEEGVPLGKSNFDLGLATVAETDEEASVQEKKKKAGKMSRQTVLIISLVVGLLVLGGLAAFFFLGGD